MNEPHYADQGCPACHGTGVYESKLLAKRIDPCPYCDGDGRWHVYEPPFSAPREGENV